MKKVDSIHHILPFHVSQPIIISNIKSKEKSVVQNKIYDLTLILGIVFPFSYIIFPRIFLKMKTIVSFKLLFQIYRFFIIL